MEGLVDSIAATATRAASRQVEFLRGQQVVLEQCATGAPLAVVLEGIVRLVEAQASDMLCTVLLLDRAHGVMRHGAAPSVPESFSRAIDGAPIGPEAGSCGTAAYLGTVVEVADIATHPYWVLYREAALAAGLRACWSTPIFAPNGDVLGTFAMYYAEPRLPTDGEREWVATATHLASIAIMRERAQRTSVQLANSEAELRAIVDNAAFGIALVGRDGMLKRVNPALCRMLGYTAEELISLPISAVSHPEDLAPDMALAEELLTGKRDVYHLEKRYLRKDGATVWGRLTGSLVRVPSHPEGVLGVGLIEDITERKRLEAQVLRSQRLDGLARLAGAMAHDFNNVLTTIQGSARLAIDELAHHHPARTALEDIELASARATDLVRRILAFSPNAEQQRTPHALAPMVREVVALVRASLPANIELRDDISESAPHVRADPTQIHQLVLNLATNAVQAMPDGGLLSIRLDAEMVPSPGSPELAPGAWARLTVSDTGVGIEKAALDQIFEPFYTTKPPGQGTGLGLAIVNAVVQAHEGAVRVTSEVGRGSTFVVWLPGLAPADQPVAAQVQARVTAGRGEQVLFVDDEPIIGKLARRELERAGFRVEVFDDAILALEAFRGAPDAFHAIVTDASMPHLSGFDLAREVRMHRADIPIVVISGGLWNREAVDLPGLGIRELLLKPQALRELAATLRRLLDD